MHQAVSNWITRHKHDRDRRGCVLRCESRGIAAGRHEYIHAPLHKFGSKRRQPAVLAASPAVFDGHVLAVEKPASPRPLRNACNTGPVSSGERALMNPISGFADCCARTENGQAAVTPPTNVMKSRRLTVAPEAVTTLSTVEA